MGCRIGCFYTIWSRLASSSVQSSCLNHQILELQGMKHHTQLSSFLLKNFSKIILLWCFDPHPEILFKGTRAMAIHNIKDYSHEKWITHLSLKFSVHSLLADINSMKCSFLMFSYRYFDHVHTPPITLSCDPLSFCCPLIKLENPTHMKSFFPDKILKGTKDSDGYGNTAQSKP